jgi:hypothetical protein
MAKFLGDGGERLNVPYLREAYSYRGAFGRVCTGSVRNDWAGRVCRVLGNVRAGETDKENSTTLCVTVLFS